MEGEMPAPRLEIDPSKFILVLGPGFTGVLLDKVMEAARGNMSMSSPAVVPKMPALDLRSMINEGISLLLDSEHLPNEAERAERELLYRNAFVVEPLKKMTSGLQQCGRYGEWLSNCFKLHPMANKMLPTLSYLKELEERGCLLVYTGCDDVLCKISNLNLLLPEDAVEWSNGSLKGIMNVHGVYWKPDSLQLKCEVYEDPRHPARSAMEHMVMTFREKYIISLGFCGQLDNPMLINFTRTFLTTAKNQHCFNLAMNPATSSMKSLGVELLQLPLMSSGKTPHYLPIISLTGFSKAVCKETDFPSSGELRDHQMMALLVDSKQGASEISKMMFNSPGVDFVFFNSVNVSSQTTYTVSVRVESSRLGGLWEWLWREKKELLASKGLFAVMMQTGTVAWMQNLRGYPNCHQTDLVVQSKPEIGNVPMETVQPIIKPSPKLLSPLVRQEFPILKPGVKKVPRYTVHKFHMKPPVGTSLTLPANSHSPFPKPYLNGFSDDTNMYAQTSEFPKKYERRCSLPPNIQTNPGLGSDNTLFRLAENCQSSSAELHPPSYTAIKQALLCDKYKRRQSMQTDPKTLKNLLQTKLVISDKNDLVNLRRKSDPGSYMKQRDFERRKELFIDENISWSKSYGKIIDNQVQRWKRKREQKYQQEFFTWKTADLASVSALNPQLQMINPFMPGQPGIINPLQVGDGRTKPTAPLFANTLLGTTSGGVVSPYIFPPGTLPRPTTTTAPAAATSTPIYYNPFGSPYTFISPYPTLQLSQVAQQPAAATTYLVPQPALATGHQPGLYYYMPSQPSSTKTPPSLVSNTSAVATTAAVSVPTNHISPLNTSAISIPSSCIGLFTPPTIKTVPASSPPNQELYVHSPVSPSSRKRHQSVPEKLTSLLHPPLALSSGRSSPMAEDEENLDSPPSSKKQRSTSDTTVYHSPYGYPQHSPNQNHSPHRHSASPQPIQGGTVDRLSALQTHLLQVHGITRTAVEDRQNRWRYKRNTGHSPVSRGGVVGSGSPSPVSVYNSDIDEAEEVLTDQEQIQNTHERTQVSQERGDISQERTRVSQEERMETKNTAPDRVNERIIDNSTLRNTEVDEGSVNGTSQLPLWQFLLELLVSNTNLIHWTDDEFEFQITEPTKVSQLWGQLTNNSSMNYEKLLSNLNHYFNKGAISQVHGRKLTFRFTGHIRNYVQRRRSQVMTTHEEIVIV